MIGFAHPMLLWALAGLTVPLAIHLLNRKESRIIRLGSLRHLLDSPTQQFKSIRLNEILLFALRSLLILILVLLISGVWLNALVDAPKKWVLLEKGLERNNGMTDSLVQKGYEVHYLSPGFPLIKDSSALTPAVNYRNLIDQLETENLDEAFVFSYNRAAGYSGERTSLPSNIRWVTMEHRTVDYPLQAIRSGHDSLLVRVGHSTRAYTDFVNEKIKTSNNSYFKLAGVLKDSIPVTSSDSLKIYLVSDQAFAPDRKIALAALQAIRQTVPEKIGIIEKKPSTWNPESKGDWIFWFSGDEIHANGIRNIVNYQERKALPLLSQQGANHWVVAQRLNQELAVTQNLSLQFLKMLFPGRAVLQIAGAKDERALSPTLAWATSGKKKVATIHGSQKTTFYLMIIFLIILIAERMVAYSKNQ